MRAIAVVLLALVVWGMYAALSELLARHPVTWRDLTQWTPAPAPLLGSLVLLVGVYGAHALLWRRIMQDLGIASPALASTLRVYFVSALARYVPFVKLGQLVGLAVLARRAGLPPVSATAAAVLGQFGFLTTGLIFLGITLPAAAAGAVDVPVALPLMVGAMLLVGSAAALWLLVATPLGHGFRAALTRRFRGRMRDKLGAAFELADRVRPLMALTWAVAYALTWLLLALAFVTFVGAFFPAAWQDARLVAGTVAAAYLLGYLFFVVPAGVGVRETVMIALLQLIMPLSAAIVITVASRVWFTVAELIPLAALPLVKSEPLQEREAG
ncbi:MAG TPA: lysylphosphatidylglycerol synthase domain-containing protein [Longimicrobiales bacterium]|nr:lysylphosphatidylglycerol synthase domain-containing protein [Longimicrobiales bacterium]